MFSEERIKPYKDFVESYYATKDPAHNFRHIERIVGRLKLFLEDLWQPIDFDTLYFLACFHGLGKLLSSNSIFKAQVKTFLKGMTWKEDDIEDVFQRLDRHLTDPQSIEEKIVHDANYIETLGAIGIAKAFTTGGAKGQSLEESANIFEYQYLDKVIFGHLLDNDWQKRRKAIPKSSWSVCEMSGKTKLAGEHSVLRLEVSVLSWKMIACHHSEVHRIVGLCAFLGPSVSVSRFPLLSPTLPSHW